jgi:cold-inducible RNA-binding protein
VFERVGVRLFVGNLDYSVGEAELRAHFAPVGDPSQVALPVDRETGRPRGFAFVEFADHAIAEAVIQRFNGQALKGRPLAISEARAREDRPPLSGPRPPRPAYGGGGFGGGGSSGFGGGGFSDRPPPPPRAPRGADFPPDAGRGPSAPAGRDRRPAKAKAKPDRPAPRGPIRERSGGRMLDIDDAFDEAESADIDFDDPATSKPREDEDEG